MEKARNSGLLKVLSYILIPILVLILGFSIFHICFLNEYGDITDATKYVDSEQFANQYFNEVLNKISQYRSIERGSPNNFIKIESKNGDYYYSDDRENSGIYTGIPDYINYIIVNKTTNIMYTNIKSENYEQEMNNMKNAKIYWNYIDGKIETSIEKINSENIKYNYSYFYRSSAYLGDEYTDRSYVLDDYDIYTSYDNDKVNLYTAYGMNQALYEYMMQNKTAPIYGITISLILLVAITVYLFWAIGHKEGKEEIDLNTIDNIPYEILAIICIIIATMFLSILANMGGTVDYIILIVGLICYFVCYAACAVMGVTTIKRIKAKKFFKSFLTYRIIRWIVNKIRKVINAFQEKTSENRKLFWYYIGFLAVSVMLISLSVTGIAVILLIAFWVWVYYKLKEYIIKQEKIKNALKSIYEGKTDIKLEPGELKGVLKEMAIYVNDIAGGFSNAIQESLKSERLKTELITNVSHDIKTPLTSIINYVDLLKKEDIKDEKVKEYIDILEQKSQRLKKLIEDLVEASKVSSGNVKLNIEAISIKELFQQTIGEFKDRFEEKGLKIEVQMPNEGAKVKADSRYLYRVIENLFSNITKYALENSRVYIDVKEGKKNKEGKETLNISIKNISKEKLNISSEELMQRFVRGDRARHTEGSGLGLSIAKSLTELQGGKFDITIDGDLFKVDMEWNRI